MSMVVMVLAVSELEDDQEYLLRLFASNELRALKRPFPIVMIPLPMLSLVEAASPNPF